MKNPKKTLSVLALLVLAASCLSFLQPVYAYPQEEIGIDFEVRLNATCPCSTITPDDVQVMVTNRGNITGAYKMSLQLPADDGLWSGFIPPEVVLTPGLSEIVPVFITPTCDVQPGEYVVGVKVTSPLSGESFTKEMPITILSCHQLRIRADRADICQGIDSSADVRIVNDGASDERVRLSLSEDWASLHVTEIDVARGEEGIVTIDFSPPPEESGLQAITITAESLTSYARTEKELVLNIRRCYESEVAVVPATQDVCPCKAAESMLRIKNTGLRDDTFYITYENESRQLVVGAEQIGELGLSFEIPCDMPSGEYVIPINVDSHTPASAKMTMVVQPLFDCYSVSLSTENQLRAVQVGHAVTFQITIENTGEFSQSYQLSLQAPDFVHMSDDLVEIPAAGQADVFLYAAPDFYIPAGEYEAVVTAESETESDSIAFTLVVESDLDLQDMGPTPSPSDQITTPPNATEAGGEEDDNLTFNISIPTTGAVIGDGQIFPDDENGQWTQITLLAILGLGVVIILILRFVILMK